MPRIASEVYASAQGIRAQQPWTKKTEHLTKDDVNCWEAAFKTQKPGGNVPAPRDGFDVLRKLIYQNPNATCHWCGISCTRELFHDEPPPLPFTKAKSQAKHPASAFTCRGCWLWRRQRIGINYLTGGWGDGRKRDGQTPANHSWWITPDEALAVDPTDYAKLYELLMKPPICFVLMLMTPPTYYPNGQVDPKSVVGNALHLAVANDFSRFEKLKDKTTGEEIDVEMGKVEMGTKLGFTINNVEHAYSVYELENAFRDGGSGKEPGVQALIRFLGAWPKHLTPKAVESIKTVDRKVEPPDAKELKKVIK